MAVRSLPVTLALLAVAGPARALRRAAPAEAAHDAEVLTSAKCGVVMMALGEEYSNIAAKVATYTRRLGRAAGWCPLDPALDHVPVTLFTDSEAVSLAREGVGLIRIRDYKHNVTIKRDDSMMKLNGASGEAVLPGAAMPPWTDSETFSLQQHLGSWNARWYHVQSILQSPYQMTVYLDVDAYACSAKGLSRLIGQVIENDAVIGTPLVPKSMMCRSSKDDCMEPHPDIPQTMMNEWANFHERNAGVLVVDMRGGRPIIQDFANNLAHAAGRITGDQYALRSSLFMHRDLKQVIFSNEDVCRYKPTGDCSDGSLPGCSVHHTCHMQSLVRYGVVPEGTFASLGLKGD